MKIFTVIFLAASSLSAQPSPLTATNPAAKAKIETGAPLSAAQRAEPVRAECLQGRRFICGKILKVLPGGLVVDSGYTDLLRPPLNSSWLVPGSVTARRAANLIEASAPEAVCAGIIFLTDLPKSRGPAARPKLYDYVMLLGYPAGTYTYPSVGDVKKTVRRFSADLPKAVDASRAAAEKSRVPAATEVK